MTIAECLRDARNLGFDVVFDLSCMIGECRRPIVAQVDLWEDRYPLCAQHADELVAAGLTDRRGTLDGK